MAGSGPRFFRHKPGDPFRHSLMGRPIWGRLGFVALGLACFWLAVAWAVAVP